MARLFSPRWIVACVVLLFSTNAFAVQAVLGVDLGTEYIKAALVKPGIPLEIVLTKDSRRKETSAVAFKPDPSGVKPGSYPERLYGSDAMAVSGRFPSDVYPNLKTLLGLPVDDASVKAYLERHPALQLEASKLRNTAAFKSKAFTDDVDAWLVEELLAMQLQSVQRNAEALAGSDTSVRSVVITVPPFYTIEEKRAVQTAAELVGLKVLSLISDGLAVGLNYATSRQFPVINEGGKPEYHMVFDMGAGSTSATVMKFQGRTVKDVGKFNKTIQEVQVLGTGWDRTLGGDALNYLIVDDMISKFVETSAAKKASVAIENVQGHGRAMAKLLKDAEKVRHVLSANQDTATSFEGLYDDVDFKYKISRAEFEALAEGHAARVGAAIQKALDVAELDITQLDSIILHGGASRTPFVQKALEKIASSDKLRSNVNSDEAAVFGAGFRAAEISPSFRVKEIRILDGSSYPAGFKYTDVNGKTKQQRLWTERSLLGAAAKEITLNNHEDFTAQFYQQVPSVEGTVDRETKVLTTKNLTASVAQLKANHNCADSDIHFKLNLRLGAEDGEVDVVKATVECEADETDKEGSVMDGVKNLFGFGKKDQQPLGEGDNSIEDTESIESASTTASTDTATTSSVESSTTSSGSSAPSSTGTTEGGAATKKQLIVIPVQFALEKSGVPQIPKEELSKAKDRIKAFEASDKGRRAREEALNQLEGFTYKVRDLLEAESFLAASTEDERATLEQKASAVSDWLYEDGADAPRDELKARLKELKDIVTPVEKRIQENLERPELVKSLRGALDQTATFIDSIKQKISEAEAFSSTVSSNTASTEASSTITAAPSSSGDFEGLEDDDFTSSTTTATTLEDRGPVPPLYTLADLKEITDLSESTMKWLEEKLIEQAKLAENMDPVLLIKDITERTKKLEKAGMDLAMKAVNNFDSKGKKKSSSKKSTKSKKKASTKTDSSSPEHTIDLKDDNSYIKFGGDGEQPSAEEIEEMIKKLTKEHEEKEAKKEEVPTRDEL